MCDTVLKQTMIDQQDDTENEFSKGIMAYWEDKLPAMLALLEEMVLIQSGSKNKNGVDKVGRVIGEQLRSIGLNFETHRNTELGDHRIARSKGVADQRNLLLIGYMDTVFPQDTHFKWFRQDAVKAYGPGVADMKGGLVVGIFALKALAAVGLLRQLPLVFIFNSDEEIGSPSSAHIIAHEAQKAKASFVLECAGLNGEVVTGRKGRMCYRLDVKGIAGHSAFAKQNKASALLEIAHKVTALESLNRLATGITVNMGQLWGGTGPNTVPDHATAFLDVRFTTNAEKKLFQRKLAKIMKSTQVAGTHSSAVLQLQTPVMNRNKGIRDLFRLVSRAAKIFGREVEEEFRPGCSDANLVAAQGTPVIDGLGPLGGHDHSDREFIIKKSLLDRAKLLALTLYFSKQPERPENGTPLRSR